MPSVNLQLIWKKVQCETKLDGVWEKGLSELDATLRVKTSVIQYSGQILKLNKIENSVPQSH